MDQKRSDVSEDGWYQPLSDDTPELRTAFFHCQRVLDHYNALPADQPETRRKSLVALLASFGEGSIITPRLKCVYGRHLSIGDHVHINSDSVLSDDGYITVGDHVRMGPRVQLLTALHPVDDHLLRRAGWERTADVEIASDVWLGAGVIVCPGVTIGARSVIGAGSVVTRNLRADVFAAGSPCRVIRELIPEPARYRAESE